MYKHTQCRTNYVCMCECTCASVSKCTYMCVCACVCVVVIVVIALAMAMLKKVHRGKRYNMAAMEMQILDDQVYGDITAQPYIMTLCMCARMCECV